MCQCSWDPIQDPEAASLLHKVHKVQHIWTPVLKELLPTEMGHPGLNVQRRFNVYRSAMPISRLGHEKQQENSIDLASYCGEENVTVFGRVPSELECIAEANCPEKPT